MGLFDFVSGWRDALIGRPLDVKMRETADVLERELMARIHVRTGYLKSTTGVTYRQSDKTITAHFDAPYAFYEFRRGGAHDAATPALQAAARLWGGNFELSMPNAHVPASVGGKTRQIHAITNYHQSMGRRLASRTRVILRRHRRLPLIPSDPTTPLL